MKYSLCDDFMNSKKVLPHFFDHANDYLDGKCDFYPHAVEVHPTARCNHECIHCSYKERNENRVQMDESTFDRLMESLITMKVSGVFFSGGGEPCIYPYLKNGILKLSESGVESAIITNGSLVEKMGIIDIADKLNYIAVSVPSVTKENFLKITGKDYVEEILSLPNKIRRIHKEQSPVIGTRVVITNIIATEVPLILRTLKECGYDYANFKIVRDYESRGLGVDKETEKRLQEDVEKLIQGGEISSQYTNLDRIFDYRKPYNPTKTCHMSRLGMLAAITPEGEVYHNISEIGKDEFLIGNLHEHPLEELWNSPRHNEVKKQADMLWSEGKCHDCRSISFNSRIDEVITGIPKERDPFV